MTSRENQFGLTRIPSAANELVKKKRVKHHSHHPTHPPDTRNKTKPGEKKETLATKGQVKFEVKTILKGEEAGGTANSLGNIQ